MIWTQIQLSGNKKLQKKEIQRRKKDVHFSMLKCIEFRRCQIENEILQTPLVEAERLVSSIASSSLYRNLNGIVDTPDVVFENVVGQYIE